MSPLFILIAVLCGVMLLPLLLAEFAGCPKMNTRNLKMRLRILDDESTHTDSPQPTRKCQ